MYIIGRKIACFFKNHNHSSKNILPGYIWPNWHPAKKSDWPDLSPDIIATLRSLDLETSVGKKKERKKERKKRERKRKEKGKKENTIS